MTPVQFFRGFLEHVSLTPEWAAMEVTVEGTPWHREANVAVHTLMTMQHYALNTAKQRTPRQQRLTLLALMFHDFGKPSSETTNEEGRHRYTGHEQVSKELMYAFFKRHPALWSELSHYGYIHADLAAIADIVDHHLPYSWQKKKLLKVKASLLKHLGEDMVVYTDVLRADCAGRMSDDHVTKIQTVEDWITHYEALVVISEEEQLRIRAERKAAWFAAHPELAQ